MDAPTQAQKIAAMASRFPVEAWSPDGRTFVTLKGPISPSRLYSPDDRFVIDNETVKQLVKQHPVKLPHGLATKLAAEIGCAPKTILRRVEGAREANRGES